MDSGASSVITAEPNLSQGNQHKNTTEIKIIQNGIRRVKRVQLPLEVGTKIPCLWRDGQHHPAKIIERRKSFQSEDYEYYVHYSECKCRSFSY